MSNREECPQPIDVGEDDLLALSAAVLDALLHDHTTGKNIYWATHDYEAFGPAYSYYSEILPHLITGERGMVIRPRVLKSKAQQTDRVKDMAEVFTPSWVVRKMVDYIAPHQLSPEGEGVRGFVTMRCLELTCGEAPFLVSRYDATTGQPIAIGERVGVLDRKLRMVNEQSQDDAEWLAQVRQAFQTTYGYEWQGDNLLLARENLLYTFIDYYEARFGSAPDTVLLQDFAEIIAWNLWQMDGLSYRIPREKAEASPETQFSLFDAAPAEPPAPLCIMMNWQTNNSFKVNEIKNRLNNNADIMKFDVIIGNPPYQEEQISENADGSLKNYAPPVYDKFMDAAFQMADCVELIHPARFLFNAGSTPKAWNQKMLNDSHFKVLMYEEDGSRVFPSLSTPLRGGVAITYRNGKNILAQ